MARKRPVTLTVAVLASLVSPAKTFQSARGTGYLNGAYQCSRDIDYVVVGGGVAGLVVAEQLSRNPKVNIVVLEAGPDGTQEPLINTPAYGPRLNDTRYMWNFTAQPDPGLDGFRPPLSQGHGWGGGSQVNYMVYCRGSPSVFDEWAHISGDEGLRWDNLLNDFKATSHYQQQDIDYDPRLDLSAYGHGPVEVTANRDNIGFNMRFANALKEVLGLPNVDFNGGTGLGVTSGPSTIRASNRTRHYALPAYGWRMADRSNVDMIHDAWVSNIGFSGKRATNVTFHSSDASHSIRTICTKQVILAAGALNSPKLLMLSGVGPKKHLSELGIPIVSDIPGIGSHLYDHHYSFLEYEVTQEVETAWQISENATFRAIAERQYTQDGSGRLGSLSGPFAITKVPDEVYDNANCTSRSTLPPDRGQLLYQFTPAAKFPGGPNVSIISPFVALVQPQGHGHVRLNSRDFRDDPLIYSNYYATPGDRAAILYGYKKLQEVMASQHTSPVVVREIFPGENVTSDEDLWKAIQQSAQTFHHPAGTVALGRVLDRHYRIKGLEGIRVVDSSTFPTIPTCHLQGTVYAYARHVAGVIMKDDYDEKRDGL